MWLNNLRYSGSRDKTLKQWDIKSGRLIRTYEDHTEWVKCCEVSSDNQFLFSSSDDKTIKQWDIETGEVLETAKGKKSAMINCCVLSKSGQYIFSGKLTELFLLQAN